MNASDLTKKTVDFLVIGAGLAGLAFACDAHNAGKSVCVLDKGRGVGGRMATRRMGNVRVDHGAQFFTARGPRFQALVDGGLENGWIQEWSQGFPQWKNGAIESRAPGHARYMCPQGMSEFAKQLAQGLNVQTGAQAAQIEKAPGESDDFFYRVTCADGRTFEGNAVMLCLPPLQLLTLARPLLSEETQTRLNNVTYDPAWTLLLHLETDLPGADWPAVEFDNHPVLGWVSRDNTKRGPNAPPVLVVHGSGKWSAAHLEDEKEAVQAALMNALEETFGPLPVVLEAQVHRWRYANPTHLLGEPFFWDTQTRIGGAGDWAGGGNVEGAVTSGWELAHASLRD